MARHLPKAARHQGVPLQDGIRHKELLSDRIFADLVLNALVSESDLEKIPKDVSSTSKHIFFN